MKNALASFFQNTHAKKKTAIDREQARMRKLQALIPQNLIEDQEQSVDLSNDQSSSEVNVVSETENPLSPKSAASDDSQYSKQWGSIWTKLNETIKNRMSQDPRVQESQTQAKAGSVFNITLSKLQSEADGKQSVRLFPSPPENDERLSAKLSQATHVETASPQLKRKCSTVIDLKESLKKVKAQNIVANNLIKKGTKKFNSSIKQSWEQEMPF